jgi:hypothetical protein
MEMATTTAKAPGVKPAQAGRKDFEAVVSRKALGRNLPQSMGRRLWAPMWAMAVMAFGVGIVLAIVRASAIADDPADVETIAALQHYTAGFMFLGFAAVLAAVSFAIARILGVFRVGGGQVQEASGVSVQTLKMPKSAKGMLLFMMMGMMAIVGAVILHFIIGATVPSSDPADIMRSGQWFDVLEGVRRIGVGMMLFGILLGLATIVKAIRFQAVRIREVPDEAARS